MDLETLDYSQILLDFFGISKSFLPTIRPSYFENFGTIADNFPFPRATINVIVGDQQASLIGHWRNELEDCAKCTFGTGAFLLKSTTKCQSEGSRKFLRTVLCFGTRTVHLEEYPIVCAGSLVSWMKQNINLISSVADLNVIQPSQKPFEEAVYFVPNLSGCLFPLWDSAQKGSLHSITLKTTKEDIILSVLESIAFSVRFALRGQKIGTLSIDGGMCNNTMFCQMLADICRIKISKCFLCPIVDV